MRRKFYNPDGDFNFPVYLEPEITRFIDKLSAEKKLDRSKIVNRLLKKDIEIIEF